MIHRMAAGLLVLICTAAQAVDSRFELLLDLDGNASTGCTVTTPAGNFTGVETILTTHVQTEGLDQAEVVLVERQDCANPETDTFGPTETVSTDGWPVGIGNGVDGFNVIETSMPLGQSNRFSDIRLAVVATDELGNVSVVLEQSPGGGPITLEGIDSLPVDFAGRIALGLLAAMLLVIGLVVMSRRGRLTLTAVALLSAGGVAGAACLLDGEIFDWSNDDQVATTGATDSTSGVDIRAVFAKRSDGHSQLCVRIDAALVFPDTLVATLSVSPSELEFIEDETGEVTVTNDAGSPVAAENVVATIPGGSDISVQGTTCGASLAVGDSCQITFTAPAAEGPTDIAIAGSNTSTETVAVTVEPTPVATLNVTPTTLAFIENESGEVTVTNDAGSPVAAENVVATIPGGSDISVQGTTCGASLAVGDSCQITFTASAPEGPTDIVIAGSNTSTETVAVTVDPTPVADLIVTPTELEFIEDESGEVTVTNDAGSPVAAENVVANIPGGSDISVQGTTCDASLAVGDSCQITFTAPAPEGPTDIAIAGSNTSTETVAVTVDPTPVATLNVTPTTLEFIENESGEVTVTNDAGSPVAAENVVATIPGGSDISVQGTTCGASLAIGDSCQITFTAPAPEGPTDIAIAGSNTSTETVAVTVDPTPVATLNVTPTTLEFIENESGEITVTNDANSPVAAENVVATIPGGSDISVQGTTCGASLAIGASCQITFTAPAPEGPTDIAIAGSNTNTVLVAVTVNPLQFTVTPSAGANGSITPANAQVVNAGSSLTFEATPDTGFAVNQWRLDGDLVQTGGTSFQLNNIQANHAVQVTFDQTTLSPLTQNLALSVNNPGADPALSGTARIIRIENTGSMPASNVQVSTTGFPVGTSITNNTCAGTLNAGDACDITVTPGGSASPDNAANACTTAPGTEPVPTTVSVTADNAPSTNINVLILGYGCIYQGGFLFAVDDSTPNTTSIGGKVAALSDQSTGVRWGPLATVGGISETSTAAPDACNGSGDGQCNTSLIIAAGLTPPVAAQLCEDSSGDGFTDWYLPAICEAGRFVGLGSDAGCGTTNPNLYTALHTNNLGGFASGSYWSSTEFSANPTASAWLQSLDSGAQGADSKSNAIRVRCVRAF
jgi:hypothetical protein